MRVERKLFAIADEMEELAEEFRRVDEELELHRHLADDAARDATVGGGEFDRLDAGLAAADVRRFERRLQEILRRRSKLDRRREKLLARLGD